MTIVDVTAVLGALAAVLTAFSQLIRAKRRSAGTREYLFVHIEIRRQ